MQLKQESITIPTSDAVYIVDRYDDLPSYISVNRVEKLCMIFSQGGGGGLGFRVGTVVVGREGW